MKTVTLYINLMVNIMKELNKRNLIQNGSCCLFKTKACLPKKIFSYSQVKNMQQENHKKCILSHMLFNL